MKRLFSKKSGFTLVEILVAFAVFAIMASMVVQILNLTVNRKKEAVNYEKNLQEQEQTLILKGQNTTYDDSQEKNGELELNFGESDSAMKIEYQLKSADGTIGDKNGINYFVGNITYDGDTSGSIDITPPGSEDPDDPNAAAGAQTDRFDTRITGTKGINYIKVYSVTKASDNTYTLSVMADDSTVQSDNQNYAQFTMYFGSASEAGNIKIKSITSSGGSGLTVRKSGNRGVKVGVTTQGAHLSSGAVFTVEFEEGKAPADELTVNSFGQNSVGGEYGAFTMTSGDKTYKYENLYGAFPKS